MNANFFLFAEKHLCEASTSMLNISSTEMNGMRKSFATKVMLFEGEFTKVILFKGWFAKYKINISNNYYFSIAYPQVLSQSLNRT